MIGFRELLIVLVVVLLVFGTRKLRNLGGDLGSSLRDFKKALKDGEEKPALDDDKAVEAKVGDAKLGEESKTEAKH